MDFKKNPNTHFKDIEKLDKQAAQTEIMALREGIEHHDYWYYVRDAPKISDATYDKLLCRLTDLEEAFPEFQSPDSPTQRVGGQPAANLKKVSHVAPMLSLNAVYEEEDVANFVDRVGHEAQSERVQYVVEPKFDGLSIELVYEDGNLTRGATRGDGQTGEDVSHNIKTIHAVPLHLRKDSSQVPSLIAVRGEVFMHKAAFQQINKHRVEQGDEPFANPRNAAAGTIRQLDPKKAAEIPLDIVFYEVLEVRGHSFASHWDMLAQLPRWGLKTDPHNKECSSLDQVKKYHNDLAAGRDALDYEIDGVVLKLNDYDTRERLGTRQRSPRWALAWKFAPRREVTTLYEIVVQVGRTGMLTPVALLDPVNVGGVTVSRATLHNADDLRRKDVRPGDKVRIERAGDVIPEVVERIAQRGKKRDKPFSMPKRCPVCGTDVYREGAYVFCPASLTCRAQQVGRLTHYASREAMDIGGLGDQTAKELVDNGMVETIADLYDLSVDDLKQLTGFAEKSATQLRDAIEEAKTPRMDRFVYALGIRHVGEHIAQILSRHFQTMDALEQANLGTLSDIEEIGTEIAHSVHAFFNQKENKQALHRLYKAGITVQSMPAAEGSGPLAGKTFVFTGQLESFSRSEAQRSVEDLGGRATSSVSDNTDVVVVGANPGQKLDEAKKRHVKTIDEKRFRKLIHA